MLEPPNLGPRPCASPTPQHATQFPLHARNFLAIAHVIDPHSCRESHKSGGVALESSFSRLKAALDPTASLWSGMVAYTDQSKRPISFAQFPANVMIKRPAFASEREFRLGYIYLNDDREEPGSTDADLARQPPGVALSVQLNELLTRIVISPDAGAAFIDAVGALGSKYGIAAPIVRSSLNAPPLF